MFQNLKRNMFGKQYFNFTVFRYLNTTNRILTKHTNVYKNSPTLLQQKIQKEHKYVQPYTYILQTGKLITTKLYEGFNVWLDIPEKKLYEIIDIASTIQQTTLIIDDVIDNSQIRNSLPSAHTIFGLESTINTVCFIYTLILDAVADLGHAEAQKVFIKHFSKFYKGQTIVSYWTENQYCPTETEFEESISLKTENILSGPLKLMELFSKYKYDFQPFLKIFSKYMHILDDYNDLIAENHSKSQHNTDDISAGRYSFPIIHALHNNPNDNEIKRILNLKTRNNDIKKYLVSLLQKYGSIEYTSELLITLEKEVFKELNKIGENSIMVELMNSVKSTEKYSDVAYIDGKIIS